MLKVFKRFYGPAIMLALFIIAFSSLTQPARAIEISSVSLNVVTKDVNCGQSVSFSSSDFSDVSSDAKTIRISSVPDLSLGVLKVGEKLLEAGSTLTISDLDDLTFCAGDESGIAAMFEVSAITSDGSEKNVAVVVRLNEGPNYAPNVQNISLKTYKGVSIGGSFKAIDPDGDVMSFDVDKNPGKGSVMVIGNRFIYTPAANRTGRDSFTYRSTDSRGNISKTATVNINISKQKSDVTYSDMAGSASEYAAVRLAEDEVFVGEKLGNSCFFSPGSAVTRGEFLALCMRACDLSPVKNVDRTGFDDDFAIEVWLKPYVSAAVLSGIIGGYESDGSVVFNPDRPITFAEAAVMLNKALKISDVQDAVAVSSFVPSWASQAAANLASYGIMPSDSLAMTCGCLTRADVAEMLCAAMDYADQKDGHSLLNWAKR